MFAYSKHHTISWRGLAHRLWLLGFALFAVSGNLLAANVQLAWDASASPSVGGYKVYYGQGSRNYTSSVDVGNATSYSVTGLQVGATYYFAVSVYDSTRTFESRYSAETTATIPTPSTGLVAAYGFDEANGLYAQDASGSGNYGSIAGAVRTTGGYFGNALKFDGVNDWVTTQNSPSLALTTGMTLEAWVYPTTWMNGMRTVIIKEQPATATSAGAGTYLLAANNSTNQPMSAVRAGNEVAVGGNMQIPPNQWTHLATTYDGQYQSLYVNGVLVSMMPQTGPVTTSTGTLKIGGNCMWGGFFQGYIDEVRVYNRALSNMEIVQDSRTPISASNPLKFVAGDKNVGSTVISIPAGTAQAFKITPQTAQTITNIQFYLDDDSTATGLQAGIYTSTGDGQHPYGGWGGGALTTLKANAWNSVSFVPRSLAAGRSYWIVILGTGGTVNLRGLPGIGTTVTETSASSTLASLPSGWLTGGVSSVGPVSVYGAGY